MTLQLPPASNWSQLETERSTFLRNSAASSTECFPALLRALFLGLLNCRLVSAARGVSFPAFERGFDSCPRSMSLDDSVRVADRRLGGAGSLQITFCRPLTSVSIRLSTFLTPSPLVGSDVVTVFNFPVVALYVSIASQLDLSYYPITSLKPNLFLAFPAAILMVGFWWIAGGILDGGFRLKGEIGRRAVACLGIAAGIAVILGGLYAIHSCWQFPIMAIGAFAWGLLMLSCSSWALMKKKWSQKVAGFNV